MFPLYDENPTFRTPVVTIGLIAAMFAVWVFVQGGATLDAAGKVAASVCNLGLVPAELTHLRDVGFSIPLGPGARCAIDNDSINWLTPLTSMFLHGSWGHIISNCLFLWVFGNNVEDVMGRLKFLVFYLLCGLVAAATHILVSPSSPVPTVGASGAISATLGAYMLLYPSVRVRMWLPPVFLFRLPAWLVLGWWFVMQFLSGLPQLLAPSPAISGGVAVWAHIGGFVSGLVLSKLFMDRDLVEKHRAVLGAAGAN